MGTFNDKEGGIIVSKREKNKKAKNNDSVFSFRGKRFRNGSFSATMLVIAIAIVVVLNLIISKLPSKYTEIDVSGNNMYSIGDETKKLLKNLDEDVTLYYMLSETQKDQYPELTKLLQQYADASDHIKLETKDPELYPSFGDKYDATDSTAVIIESDKRFKLLDGNDMYTISNYEDAYYYGDDPDYQFTGENLLANAVNYVSTDNLPKMYTLQGEGELTMDSSIETLITDSNITVDELNLMTQDAVPDDCDCLLIYSPENDFNKDTTKAILTYLKKGGNAIIISDYQEGKDMPNFASILKEYGVEIEKGLVYEGDANYAYQNTPTYLIPELISLDFTTDLVSAKARMLMVSSQGIKELDDKKDTLDVMSMLTTSQSSFLKEDPASAESYSQEEGDKSGPFDVAVAITDSNISEAEAEESGETQEVKTKLAVFGTSAILDASIYSNVTPSNAALFTTTLGWMCECEDSISIASKSMSTENLTITDGEIRNWAVLYLAVIPVLVLATGVIVTVKRNRR